MEDSAVAPRPEQHGQPVSERVPFLDVLRAFALLGIYISIIHGFNGSILYGTEAVANPVDRLIGSLESLLINKRFIGLLSLLFGIGIAIQQQNFKRKNLPFTGYFIRRMAVLACFGLINTTFYFNGEILLVYAIFGLVTLSLSRVPTRFILALAVFLFLVPGQIFEVTARNELIEWFSWFPETYPAERVMDIYLGTDYWEMVKLRWTEYAYIYTDNNFHLAMSLAMISLGYAIGRGNHHATFLKRWKEFSLILIPAAAYTTLFAVFALLTGMTDFIFAYNPIGYVFYAAFLLTSMYTYVALLGLVFNLLGPDHPLMRTMANNGRLCLTGYMGGALLYSFIFYGYGLGWYMKYSNTVLLLIALASYCGFTLFSSLWLKRFKRGPLEWAYRRLSYGKLD